MSGPISPEAMLAHLIDEATAPPDQLWWLSFVNTDLPKPPPELDVPGGPRWAGACIVHGPTFLEAVHNSHQLGCNPGGAVKGYPFPADGVPDQSWMGRLLTREDVDQLDAMEEPTE